MKTIIIVPTYNERDNIGALIDALQAQFARVPSHDWHVLVVDDRSPDGTAEVVRRKQGEYPNVHLLLGDKTGLGAAYIRGMIHSLEVLGAEVVFEMDADFSHKPEDVLRLMQALEEGADFVIGSRYVAGGSIPGTWGPWRRLNSLFGNIVARYVAGIYRVRDCTAGFRAIRAEVVRNAKLDQLRVQGYAFQVALLHEAVVAGAKIREIPVDFVDRKEGESKLGLRDIIEFILNAWGIRFRGSRTFLKFCGVGLSGVVVNLGLFALLLHFGLNRFAASPIAIQVSILSNFALNNAWTFRRRKTRSRLTVRGLKFNVVSLLSLGVSYSVFVALSVLIPKGDPLLFQAIGIVPATLVNYFLNSYWTFRHVPDSTR